MPGCPVPAPLHPDVPPPVPPPREDPPRAPPLAEVPPGLPGDGPQVVRPQAFAQEYLELKHQAAARFLPVRLQELQDGDKKFMLSANVPPQGLQSLLSMLAPAAAKSAMRGDSADHDWTSHCKDKSAAPPTVLDVVDGVRVASQLLSPLAHVVCL